MKPLGPFAVDRDAVPAQQDVQDVQDVQASIAEPSVLLRYETHQQLKVHFKDFIAAYFAR